MNRLALREHASLLSAKLGPERIGYGLPTLDSDLAEWIQQVQRVHLLPLNSDPLVRDRFADRVRVETDRNGDRVETESYTDARGDEVIKKIVTDRFGGEYEQTTVRDPVTMRSRTGPKIQSRSPTRRTMTSERVIEDARYGDRRPLGSRPLYVEDPLYRRSLSPSRRLL